jgi:hypothetical protein
MDTFSRKSSKLASKNKIALFMPSKAYLSQRRDMSLKGRFLLDFETPPFNKKAQPSLEALRFD